MKYLKILYLSYLVILFLCLYDWLMPRLAALKPVADRAALHRGNGVRGPAGVSRGPQAR